MSAKHTPGPWKVVSGNPALSHRVMTVDTWDRQVVIATTDYEPDARLIAAAPEMLRARRAANERTSRSPSLVCGRAPDHKGNHRTADGRFEWGGGTL